MKIGLVCYAYPPQNGTGGVGTYMFRLAGALGRAGHQVHVIAGPSDLPPNPQPNVMVHRVAASFQLKTSSRALRWLYWHSLARMMSWCSPRVWHLIRWDLATEAAILEVDAKYGLDLIEAPEFAGNGWMAGRIHRWPIVLRMHCPWELFIRINKMRFNPMNRVLAHLERKTVANYADAITVPSEAMKREAEKTWRLRRPIEVIPNFMDIPESPAPLPDESEPQRIVCVGRIEPLKGQDTLCKAFAMIAARHPRAELWIVGPDSWGGRVPFASILTKLVPDESIRARIKMTGQATLQQIDQYLRDARVAVISSVGFESFSLSTLEAMAVARPMVVTRTGAIPELVDNEETGLVVSPGSAYEMAVALDRHLSNPDFSRACGLAAHRTARIRYETRQVLPRMLRAYEGAADFYYGVRTIAPASAMPLPA